MDDKYCLQTSGSSPVDLITPVAFLIYNRPQLAAQVFDVIRKAKPKKLLVVADGPKFEREGDVEKCATTRSIIDTVDWDCEILTDYSPVNMGCKKRISTGLDWVFSQVPEAIVLEDDCLPSLSFFFFCQDLLSRYRHDKRVMQICGFNRIGRTGRGDGDYFFARLGPVWGWASWNRAWAHYDVEMKLWPQIKDEDWLSNICESRNEYLWRTSLYDQVFRNDINTWAYRWGFAKLINSGLSVIPGKSLIENIGFGPEATHTFEPMSQDPKCELRFPLKHPNFVLRDVDADKRYCDLWVPGVTSWQRIKNTAKNFFQRLRNLPG